MTIANKIVIADSAKDHTLIDMFIVQAINKMHLYRTILDSLHRLVINALIYRSNAINI